MGSERQNQNRELDAMSFNIGAILLKYNFAGKEKDLLAEIGLPVIERPIDRTEIYLCEEFFMTGTAAQVTAVTRVDYRPIGSGKMGPVTIKLRQLFDEVVYARHQKYTHWNLPVYTKVAEPL